MKCIKMSSMKTGAKTKVIFKNVVTIFPSMSQKDRINQIKVGLN